MVQAPALLRCTPLAMFATPDFALKDAPSLIWLLRMLTPDTASVPLQRRRARRSYYRAGEPMLPAHCPCLWTHTRPVLLQILP